MKRKIVNENNSIERQKYQYDLHNEDTIPYITSSVQWRGQITGYYTKLPNFRKYHPITIFKLRKLIQFDMKRYGRFL